MLEMRQVSKIYRTAMVETHALRSLACTCARASSSR